MSLTPARATLSDPVLIKTKQSPTKLKDGGLPATTGKVSLLGCEFKHVGENSWRPKYHG